jgi:hypothetical protein
LAANAVYANVANPALFDVFEFVANVANAAVFALSA